MGEGFPPPLFYKEDIMSDEKKVIENEVVEKKVVAPRARKKVEYVEVFLYRNPDIDYEDQFVAVNNKTYRVARGVKVSVPSFVAEAIYNAERQEQKNIEMLDRMEREYNERANLL